MAEKVIYKYSLGKLGHSKVLMHRGARVLSCGMQGGTCQVWAVVNPQATQVVHDFFVCGTGHPSDEISFATTFVGTVFDGPLVWHVFDYGEESGRRRSDHGSR